MEVEKMFFEHSESINLLKKALMNEEVALLVVKVKLRPKHTMYLV